MSPASAADPPQNGDVCREKGSLRAMIGSAVVGAEGSGKPFG